jgi:hypothetical protein
MSSTPASTVRSRVGRLLSSVMSVPHRIRNRFRRTRRQNSLTAQDTPPSSSPHAESRPVESPYQISEEVNIEDIPQLLTSSEAIHCKDEIEVATDDDNIKKAIYDAIKYIMAIRANGLLLHNIIPLINSLTNDEINRILEDDSTSDNSTYDPRLYAISSQFNVNLYVIIKSNIDNVNLNLNLNGTPQYDNQENRYFIINDDMLRRASAIAIARANEDYSRYRLINVEPILEEIKQKAKNKDQTGKVLFKDIEEYRSIYEGYTQLETILYNSNPVDDITIPQKNKLNFYIDTNNFITPYEHFIPMINPDKIKSPIHIVINHNPADDYDGLARDFYTNLGKELSVKFMFSGTSTPLITKICKLGLRSTALRITSSKKEKEEIKAKLEESSNACDLEITGLKASIPISEQPIDPNPQLIDASKISNMSTKILNSRDKFSFDIYKLACILAKCTLVETHKLGINFNMFILLILFGYTFTSSEKTLCKLLEEHESHESNEDSYEKYNAELFTCCGRLMVLLDMYPIDDRIRTIKNMIDFVKDPDYNISVFSIVIKILKEFLFIDTKSKLVDGETSTDFTNEDEENAEVPVVIKYLKSLFKLGKIYRNICLKICKFKFELTKYSPFVYASLLSSELKITVDDILKKLYITKESKTLAECEIEATLKEKNDALASSEASEIKTLYDKNYIVKFLRSVNSKITDEYEKQQLLFKFLKYITGSVILPHIIYVNLLPGHGSIVAHTCFNLIDIYQPNEDEDTPEKFEEDYTFLMNVLNGKFNIGDSAGFDLAGGSKRKTINTRKLKLKRKLKSKLKHKKTRNTHKRANKNY